MARAFLVACAAALTALVPGAGEERDRCEREINEAGLALSLFHRAGWARVRGAGEAWLIAVNDPDGRCNGAVPLLVHPSRALPGHLIVRAERCGSTLTPDTMEPAFDALAELARRPRVLRVEVELFERDDTKRQLLERALSARGFHRASTVRGYEATLALDLAPDENAIFTGLHASARREIRLGQRSPLEVRPVTDPTLAPRLDVLAAETVSRSGGTPDRLPHAAMIAMSRLEPGLSHVAGLFRTDVQGPASLIAYAWGAMHGDHATYEMGASTRAPEIKGGLGYPVLWSLITWAKRQGAEWFDLGGITGTALADGAPLGGISDFKRRFAEKRVVVGSDWIMEPHRSRAAVARVVSRSASWLSTLSRRWA